MNILEFFCKHKWISHSTKKYENKTIKPIKGTEHWFNPKFIEEITNYTKEVIICSKCGKIKTIEY